MGLLPDIHKASPTADRSRRSIRRSEMQRGWFYSFWSSAMLFLQVRCTQLVKCSMGILPFRAFFNRIAIVFPFVLAAIRSLSIFSLRRLRKAETEKRPEIETSGLFPLLSKNAPNNDIFVKRFSAMDHRTLRHNAFSTFSISLSSPRTAIGFGINASMRINTSAAPSFSSR